MTLRPHGTFPTPYGVAVPVFEDPADQESFLFNADGTAICAGIFDPEKRRRFIDDAKEAGSIDLGRAEEYGGFSKLLRMPLSKPRESVYQRLHSHGVDENGVPLERWVTLIMDSSRWCDRADGLLFAIEGNLDLPLGSEIEELAFGLVLPMMLTAALEHLVETEIDCLEAAAFYALSEHEEWRRAGTAWLHPVRETWFRKWVQAHPVYRDFVTRIRICDQSIPAWLIGDGEGPHEHQRSQ